MNVKGKYLKDEDGNIISPVTSIKSVYVKDNDGYDKDATFGHYLYSFSSLSASTTINKWCNFWTVSNLGIWQGAQIVMGVLDIQSCGFVGELVFSGRYAESLSKVSYANLVFVPKINLMTSTPTNFHTIITNNGQIQFYFKCPNTSTTISLYFIAFHHSGSINSAVKFTMCDTNSPKLADSLPTSNVVQDITAKTFTL